MCFLNVGENQESALHVSRGHLSALTRNVEGHDQKEIVQKWLICLIRNKNKNNSNVFICLLHKVHGQQPDDNLHSNGLINTLNGIIQQSPE